MITKIVYYTASEARKAAAGFATEVGGHIDTRIAQLDDKSKGLTESDSFAEHVGMWSGEMNAFRVEDDSHQTIGLFGYWDNDSETSVNR